MRVLWLTIKAGLFLLTVVTLCVTPIIIVDASGANILPNPSFELPGDVALKPEGWILQKWTSGTQVVRDATVAHSGRISPKISNPSDNDRGSFALFLPVSAGEVYRFSGWYRSEGVQEIRTGKGIIARFSLLEFKEQPVAAKTLVAQGEPSGDWTRIEYVFMVPQGITWLRLDLFLIFQTGTVWWDDVSLEKVEEDNANMTLGFKARVPELLPDVMKNCEILYQETLEALVRSSKADPDTYDRLVKLLDGSVKILQQRQVRFGEEKGKFGGDDEWQYRATAANLFVMALMHELPQSRFHKDPQLLEQIGWGMDFLARELSTDGRWHTYDTNVDRFTLAPVLETFILVGSSVPQEQQIRWLEMIMRAMAYQFENFFPRPLPWGGGYPNMDAYYAQIAALAGRLFGDSRWLQSAQIKVQQIGKRLRPMGGYEYVLGWNPVPGYQDIVIICLARYYQLTKDPEVLRQFSVARDYLPYFMEPYGMIDYGMAPHIKHYWGTGDAIGVASSEALAALTGDGRNKAIALRKLSADNLIKILPAEAYNVAYALFWLNDTKPDPLPDSFLVYNPSIMGFEQRTDGRWTSFITGNLESRDTFVSIISGTGGEFAGAVEGVLFEWKDKDGYIYYLSDMKPKVQQILAGHLAIQRVKTSLHAVGKGVRYPTPIVIENNQVRGHEWGVWNGGSPGTSPWEVVQTWIAIDGFLIGLHEATATSDGIGEYFRMYAPLRGVAKPQEMHGGDGKVILKYDDAFTVILEPEGGWQYAQASDNQGLSVSDGDPNAPVRWVKGERYGLNMVFARDGAMNLEDPVWQGKVTFQKLDGMPAVWVDAGSALYLVVVNNTDEVRAFDSRLPFGGEALSFERAYLPVTPPDYPASAKTSEVSGSLDATGSRFVSSVGADTVVLYEFGREGKSGK